MEKTMRFNRYRKMLERVQGHAVLRVTAAYRTVSTKVLLVIAGIPPISLLVEERARMYHSVGIIGKQVREATTAK